MTKQERFACFAWFFLIYNIAVIIWGAFVRASFSGDGCGNDWPFCHGTVFPKGAAITTVVELSHRLSTSIDGLLAISLVVLAFRLFPPKSPVRRMASLSFFFILTEAFVGAVLVKKGYVVNDDSVGRAVWMAIHLSNTFFLLAFASLTAIWAGRRADPEPLGLEPTAPSPKLRWAFWLAGASIFVLAISGALTALGDTLYPIGAVKGGGVWQSVMHAWQSVKDVREPKLHFLVQLRALHPFLATGVGIFLLWFSAYVSRSRPDPMVVRPARWVAAIFLIEFACGISNIWLKAPVAMQLIHLALADALWIALIYTGAMAFRSSVVPSSLRESSSLSPKSEMKPHQTIAEPVAASEHIPARAGVKEYFSLTKPRVISLLLFTTMTAMYAAHQALDGHCPSTFLTLIVFFGGYMSAGSANAINMVIDRDIDGRMVRTASRPTVTQSISTRNALIFAVTLEVASFLMLWLGANLLCALLALAGLAFYVCIYTLLLKRRTWHNIVIGGAAGAFPPLVGWAAVTGSLSPLAWWLFAIIFVWTPVHFWALALMIKDDYKAVGVPMLPVVKGDRATVVQIALYTVLTVAVTFMPLIGKQVGSVYVWTAALLNIFLVVQCIKLYRKIDRPHALGLFKYSMVYLAILFLMVAVDQSVKFDQSSSNPAKKEIAGVYFGGDFGLARIAVKEEKHQGFGIVGVSRSDRRAHGSAF